MPDRIAEHYERHAHAFDYARRKAFTERHWLDRFLIGVAKGGHILDLGCGAGEPVARYLIDHGHQITGIDVSEKMIGLSRTRFGRHVWLKADMRKAALGRQFAGILAWDSLFHLDHASQAEMIEKIGRWLEPGGMFLFNSGPEHSTAIGEQFGEELYHASLDPLEYLRLLEAGGMTVVAHKPEDPATGGRTVWLARKFA